MAPVGVRFLTGLFDRMGLQTKIHKTVGMVFWRCQAARLQVDKAYTRAMTGEGRSFKERQRQQQRQRQRQRQRQWQRLRLRQWVSYPECGKELAKGSLVTHHQTQHGVAKGRVGSEGDEAYRGGNDPRTYRMAFLTRTGPRPFPVKGCNG